MVKLSVTCPLHRTESFPPAPHHQSWKANFSFLIALLKTSSCLLLVSAVTVRREGDIEVRVGLSMSLFPKSVSTVFEITASVVSLVFIAGNSFHMVSGENTDCQSAQPLLQ